MTHSRILQSTLLSLIVTSCLLLPLAHAGERAGKRRGPPPEAVEACATLSEGASCTFSGRRGEDVQGSCIVIPDDSETIACAPAGGPRERSRTES